MGNKVAVKNLKTNEQFFLAGHKNVVSALCVSPNGNLLASGQVNHYGFKAMVIIWNFAERKIKASHEIHKVRVEDVCFTNDERYLISLGGIDDGCIVVWNVENGTPLCGTLANSGMFGNATTIARTNLSKMNFLTAGDGTLKLWYIDEKDGKLNGIEAKIGKMKRAINCLVVDENDENVYCGTTSGDILKARLNIGELQESIKCPIMIGCYSKIPKHMSRGNSNGGEVYAGGVKNLLLLPKKKIVVGAGDGTIELIEIKENSGFVKDEAKKNSLVIPCIITHRSGNVCATVTSMTRYRNDFLLVGTSLCEIHEIELSTFRTRIIVTCHTSAIHDLAFPRNSSEIFATAGKHDIRVWKLSTQKELLRITVPNFVCSSLCFDRNAGSIISAWNDGTLRGFATNSGELLFSIDCAHTKPVTTVTISNDDSKLISGGCDGQIRVWNAKTYARQLLTVLKEHRGPITSLHVSPDNESFISSSSDGTCVMWDAGTLKRKFTLRGNTMYMATCFASGGVQILTCGTDGKIAYWESLDGSLVREVEGSAVGTLNAINISPDGRYFVTGSDDCIVKLWEYRTGNIIRTGVVHAAAITGCAFAPTGDFIVTISADGAIIIWKYPFETSSSNDNDDCNKSSRCVRDTKNVSS
ncbi:cilia- and flagella-associated protein 52 isoform X2 [Osmia lignaria lignaria]